MECEAEEPLAYLFMLPMLSIFKLHKFQESLSDCGVFIIRWLIIVPLNLPLVHQWSKGTHQAFCEPEYVLEALCVV